MFNAKLTASHEATERASRPVVFEHSRTNDFFEFTGLGFFDGPPLQFVFLPRKK